MKFKLQDGVKIGEGSTARVLMEGEFRSLTAADLFAAQEAAEIVKVLPGGTPALIVSNSKLGREILRRAIRRLDDIDGPISEEMLGVMTGRDFNHLIGLHNIFEYAHSEKTEKVVADIEKKGK